MMPTDMTVAVTADTLKVLNRRIDLQQAVQVSLRADCQVNAAVTLNDVVAKLTAMKLGAAAKLVEEKIDETLTYYAFPSQHWLWLKIRTNNPMERLLREARRRTKVVGAFPDGHSALMLVTARLRHVSATQWGTRKYMNMELLKEMDREIRLTVPL